MIYPPPVQDRYKTRYRT